MTKYLVEVREVHISTRVVYANSPEAARQGVIDCEDEEEIACEYSYTMDRDTWIVQNDLGEIVLD